MRRQLGVLWLLVLTTGCATGDWNEDSIFFRPSFADRRLHAELQQANRAHARLAELGDRTTSLARALERIKQSNVERTETLVRCRREIEHLSAQLAELRRQVDGATAARAEHQAARDSVQLEIERLERRIREMRRDLLILLENA